MKQPREKMVHWLCCLLLSVQILWNDGALAAERSHKISDIEVMPITNGITAIADFDGQGHPARIISGVHQTGTAGSYNRVMILFAAATAGADLPEWSVIPVIGRKGPHFDPAGADTVRDEPHTGEDAVASLRLARARVDGQPATVLVQAWRDMATASDSALTSPALVVFEVYRLTPDEETDVPIFQLMDVTRSKTRYCNADVALTREMGFPPAGDMAAQKARGGCLN